MSASMRAPGPSPFNNMNYDHGNLNPGMDGDKSISKSIESIPYGGVAMETVLSERRGSAVFQTTLREGSSYKTLKRYQASLIYMTNQVLPMLNIEHEYDRNTKRTWTIWVGNGTNFWVLAFILANAIPIFDSILSISSALFVAWFTFGISGVMWLYLNWDVQFRGWKKTPLAILNWFIILITLFMNGAGLWAPICQLVATSNDPNTPVSSSFTCADNSIWRQLGFEP